KPFPKSKLNILLFGNGICCLLASAYALAVYTIYKNPFCKWYKRDKSGQKNLNAIFTGIFAGLLFCTSRTLWAYATVAEVYTLNTFLIALLVFCLLRWQRFLLSHNPNSGKAEKRPIALAANENRWLYASALIFGLALGVHHVTVALVLPACAAFVLATHGVRFFFSRRLLTAAGFAFLGLGIYIYLPLTAASKPLMNWGDPSSIANFISHVTGRQYQVYFEFQPTKLLGDFLSRLLVEFGPSWFPLALALAFLGLIHLFLRAQRLFWFFCVAIILNLTYNTTYEIAEDKDAYYLPVHLFVVLCSSAGLQFLLTEITANFRLRLAQKCLVFSLCTAILSISLATNYSWNNRRNYYVAEDYVRNILSTIAPSGMIISTDWQVYSPMLYFQEIEKLREDVVVIDINQLRRSWYFEFLERSYPKTMNAARSQVEAFLEDLKKWERDPELYQRDVTLNQRISERFRELVLAFIRNHQHIAPVYLTLELASGRIDSADSEWVQAVLQKYQLVPQGLVFELFDDWNFHEPALPAFVTRGLSDNSLRFAPDDVVSIKILPVYAAMAYNRARYLEAAGRQQ
ncbi:MAG: DUF2723 domain-containing protein, partial [Deltaproteobacteria bacterium]|nr:DUF2723 domain-containing protein [Deltaproteobacteria bacterium]